MKAIGKLVDYDMEKGYLVFRFLPEDEDTVFEHVSELKSSPDMQSIRITPLRHKKSWNELRSLQQLRKMFVLMKRVLESKKIVPNKANMLAFKEHLYDAYLTVTRIPLNDKTTLYVRQRFSDISREDMCLVIDRFITDHNDLNIEPNGEWIE